MSGLSMTRENPCGQTSFGYLSTLQSPDHGYFGGYLLVSPLGRPLEFHCTAPIRPSRAQEILYGPTLRPFLLGELIGHELLANATIRPSLVITDQLDAICPLLHTDFPVVVLRSANAACWPLTLTEASGCGNGVGHVAQPPPSTNEANSGTARHFVTAGYEFVQRCGGPAQDSAVVALLEELAKHVDLAEPFGRIHEAIREAQRIGSRDQETHGKAA